MSQLTNTDRSVAEALRKAQVLLDVFPPQLELARGVIMVACADGDQMPDLFAFETGLFKVAQVPPRIHELALNGGALLIAKDSPVRRAGGEDDVLLRHIDDGRTLKEITTVMLYAHAPCGAAALARLDLRTAISLLMEAKTRLKQELADLKVACFLHIDWGDRKRTYFVSRDAWERWQGENAPEL